MMIFLKLSLLATLRFSAAMAQDVDPVLCSDERPYLSNTYLTCIECRTSADCADAGDVCYVGECRSYCPDGMFKKKAVLNAEYYHKLEETIAAKDVDALWNAFDGPDEKTDRKKIRAMYKEFADDNAEFFEKPGSGVPNKDGSEMLYCACSEESDYEKSEAGWTMGTVVGHPFSNICACNSDSGYCQGYMSVDVFGLNWIHLGSSTLVPRGKPANCYGETSTLRMKLWGLTFVAIFIAIFAYRSTSSILSDFHRMNLWNIICTWIFVFMYMIDDPHLGGYNRFLGAGIFVHNAAEWNFMIRLWFGNNLRSRQITAWWGFMFLAIMMILIILLPLHTQLVLAGTLGAMLDVTFVLQSFAMIVMSKESEADENDKSWRHWLDKSLHVGESRFTGFLFLLAFISHIVALQFIFGAMSDGNLTVEVWITTLVSTFFQFILLEMFAYNQNQRAVWCMPYDESSYYLADENDQPENVYTLIDNTNATSTANPGILVKTILDGELDTNPEVKRSCPDRLVYDTSVYRDGLDSRLRGCPECPRCSVCCPKTKCKSPFAIYLTIGFVAALFVNLNLFVFEPEAYDFDNLDVGDCPSYYPLHGNGAVPNWIAYMRADHPFRVKYGQRFWQKITEGLNVLAVVGSLILFVLLVTMIGIQRKTIKMDTEIEYDVNALHKRDLVSESNTQRAGKAVELAATKKELDVNVGSNRGNVAVL